MSDILQTKSLYEMMEQFLKIVFETMNCCKIGKVIAVDSVNQTVDCEIMTKETIPQKGGERIVSYPEILKVPFVVIGGGNSYISFPISVGDEALIIFNDFDYTRWQETGEAHPALFRRHHDLSDGIALIGLRNVNRLIQNYSEFVKILYDGGDAGKSSIEVKDVSIDMTTDTVKASKDVAIVGNTTIGGTADVTGNITGSANIDGATFSTGGTAGISGTFTNAGGVTLTFTNGLITAVG